jgi:flagella basal body P-ring formation protein FlgA
MKTAINIVLLSTFLYSFTSLANDHFVDKTINDLLQERISDERIIVEQEYNSKSKLEKVKAAQEKIETIILDQFDPNYSRFRVKINYTDNKAETLSGHYVSYVMAPVAVRYIGFGKIIQQSDIKSKKTKLDSTTSNYITDADSVVGMQAKQYIAAGNMFKTDYITRPNIIKNGDPVNIVYSSGSINLKTAGMAMAPGAVGDMIKVKNNYSGAILLGQITNKNTVKVSNENE